MLTCNRICEGVGELFLGLLLVVFVVQILKRNVGIHVPWLILTHLFVMQRFRNVCLTSRIWSLHGSDKSTCCRINFLPCVVHLGWFPDHCVNAPTCLKKFRHKLVTGESVHLIVQDEIRVVRALQFVVLHISTDSCQFVVQFLDGFELCPAFVVQVMKNRW